MTPVYVKNPKTWKSRLLDDCEISQRGFCSPLIDDWLTKREPVALSLARIHKVRRMAEIGVYGGTLCHRIVSQMNEQIEEYWCVDPWHLYEEWADRKWLPREKEQEFWERRYEAVVRLAERYPQIRIVRKISIEAASDVPDDSLDFVYIDSVHDFPNMLCDVWMWILKVKEGGIIGGHDYARRFIGMIRAVDFIFREDFQVPLHTDSWYVVLRSGMRHKYLKRIDERFGNPLELYDPKNKTMFYRDKP